MVAVQATAGDNQLGGDNIDALLPERLNARLETELGLEHASLARIACCRRGSGGQPRGRGRSDRQRTRVLAVVKAPGPHCAGLTALTTAPRTLIRTGSCLSMPNRAHAKMLGATICLD